jgi:hypothetical protein
MNRRWLPSLAFVTNSGEVSPVRTGCNEIDVVPRELAVKSTGESEKAIAVIEIRA